MAGKKNKINDKERVLSLLNFFLVHVSLEKQHSFDYAIFVLTAGLVFLTTSLIFLELKLELLALLLAFFAALFLAFGVTTDLIRGRQISKEYMSTREKIEEILCKYDLDEESKALKDIALK